MFSLKFTYCFQHYKCGTSITKIKIVSFNYKENYFDLLLSLDKGHRGVRAIFQQKLSFASVWKFKFKLDNGFYKMRINCLILDVKLFTSKVFN